MNSKLMDFNKNLARIKTKIEKLKGYGINTDLYEKSIKEIEDNITMETKFEEHMGNVAVIKKMQVEPAYDDALKELKSVEKKIDEYENVLFIKSTIENVENLDFNNIDEKKLYEFESKILLCINNLNNFEIYDYKKVDELLNDVYNSAYKIIKCEIIMNGKSKIFDYIKNNDKGIEFINILVKNEITELKTNALKSERKCINELMNALNLNDSNCYANEDLIFLISFNNNDLRKLYNFSLNTSRDISKEEANKIVEIKESNNKLKENAKKVKWEKIRGIVLTTMISLFLTSGLLNENNAIKALKTECMVPGYETRVESYNTFNNKESNEVIYSEMDKNDVTITIYGEVDKKGNRTYKSYKLEGATSGDIKDYATINDSKNETDIIGYDTETQITDKPYTEVNRALYINKNEPAKVLDLDTFAEQYKSKTNLYNILKLMVTASAGVNCLDVALMFFNKEKRRKYFINEINKNNEEFEIHKSNYLQFSDRYELLKEKKKISTGYPVYDYESFYETSNEQKAKELIKNKKN